ncbi:hypothetical protein AAG906_012836 [Vitis piasezkii]
MTRGLPPGDHDGCYVLHLLTKPLIRCRIPVVEVDNSFTVIFNLCVVTTIDDDVDDDSGGGLLMLTRADFFEAFAINALICSSFLFSPSYTTLEIKVAFKASESIGKKFQREDAEKLQGEVLLFCGRVLTQSVGFHHHGAVRWLECHGRLYSDHIAASENYSPQELVFLILRRS